MSSPALFSTGASPAAATSNYLVQFKAGKMELRDGLIHPLKRPGLVYLHQSSDDNLMHFCWKDRTTETVEDDLILFPDDCEFKRVKECKTGRVYVLKMKSSQKNMFFWMQEAQTSKDEEYCMKINDLLNNPPSSNSGGSSDRELHQLLGGMTRDQMAHLLSSNGMLNSNLAGILNAARSPSSNSASSTRSTNQSGPQSEPMNNDIPEDDSHEINRAIHASQARDTGVVIDLSSVINADSLSHLISDQDFLKQVEPHLPPVNDSGNNQQQFEATIRSQQFRSSMSQFCAALQSGQLGPLMSQFGLGQGCVEAANQGNLEEFAKALENERKGH